MKIIPEPMLAMLGLSGIEVLAIVAGLLVCFVVAVAAIVAVVYFINRPAQGKKNGGLEPVPHRRTLSGVPAATRVCHGRRRAVRPVVICAAANSRTGGALSATGNPR